MTPAARRRGLRAGLAMAVVGGAGTVATAVAHAAATPAGLTPPTPLVALHVACAVVLAVGVVAKVVAIGWGRVRRRGRRTWTSLVSVLALTLGGYAALTGVLVLVDPAWSNQHLAAGFWTSALVGVHVRHRRARAARLLAPRPTADTPARQPIRIREATVPGHR